MGTADRTAGKDGAWVSANTAPASFTKTWSSGKQFRLVFRRNGSQSGLSRPAYSADEVERDPWSRTLDTDGAGSPHQRRGRAQRRPRHHPRGGCGVTTDTSELGLERLICTGKVDRKSLRCHVAADRSGRREPSRHQRVGPDGSAALRPTLRHDREYRAIVRERPSSYGSGWVCGDPQDYDREYWRSSAGVPRRNATGCLRGPAPGRRWPRAPEVPSPPPGRDQ